MIACTHPGKMGDALYALPAIRALCERHHAKADFYTSSYCEPLRSLFEYQSCIHAFHVAPDYVLERMDMGCQPWHVPVDESEYDATYQLGYTSVPDCSLPDYIARETGIQLQGGVWYDIPTEIAGWDLFGPKDYIALAPRGNSSYLPLFRDLIQDSPLPIVLVGGAGDGNHLLGASDFCGKDYLETAYIISRARAFVGLSSSPLALANGFPIPRICPHDGIHWDQRHWVQSEYNHYPVNPSTADVLALIARETA